MDHFDDLSKERMAALLRAVHATKDVKDDNVPSQIEEGLYLGSVGAANNKTLLKSLNITHILTVASSLPPAYPNDFTYKVVDVPDKEDVNIAKFFNDCFGFINEAKRTGGVLVHCFVGRSRSVTIVVAYLMKKHRMGSSEALNLVKSKRSVAAPNSGFIGQLQRYEKSFSGQRLYNDKHNVIALVDEEIKEAFKFVEIISFLKRSRIAHAISANPVIVMNHITSFWDNADYDCATEPPVLKSKINDEVIQFSVEDLRAALQFNDSDDDPLTLPNDLICGVFNRMGYNGDATASQLAKKHLFGQWRYLFHVVIMCLSNRKSGVDTLSRPFQCLIVALVLKKPFNISQLIFDSMVKQITATEKESFLQYPRFLTMIFDHLFSHINKAGPVIKITVMNKRIFADCRPKRGANTADTPLFGHVLDAEYLEPENEAWFHVQSPVADQETHSDEQPELHAGAEIETASFVPQFTVVATSSVPHVVEVVNKENEDDVTLAVEGDLVDTSSSELDDDDDNAHVAHSKIVRKRQYLDIIYEAQQEENATKKKKKKKKKKKTTKKKSDDNDSVYVPSDPDFNFESPVHTASSPSLASPFTSSVPVHTSPPVTPLVTQSTPSFASPDIGVLTDNFATQSAQILALQSQVKELQAENVQLKSRVNVLEVTVDELTKKTSLIIPLQDQLSLLQAQVEAQHKTRLELNQTELASFRILNKKIIDLITSFVEVFKDHEAQLKEFSK